MFGNHKLKLDSYESGIDEIENLFNTKIIDYKEGMETPKQTGDVNDLRFWTNHKFHKIKFDESKWGIWLNCNHEACDRIRIFKHSVDFLIPHVNTRYNNWKDLISNQYQTKEKYSENLEVWREQFKNWKEFKSFAKEIILKIGGNTILYLNDYNFQNIEGNLCTGGSFEQSIESLKKKSDGIEIEALINDKENKFEKMENWFIERL